MSETITGPVTAEDVANVWTIGLVIEDRWGLRWRADIPIKGPSVGQHGWQCRSVGLRIFRSHEDIAERGPITVIRNDRPYTGESTTADRKRGEAQDAAGTVDGSAAEDDPNA